MIKLILTEDDFYMSENGRRIRVGDHRLHGAELAVLVKRDGSFEILKNRYDLSHDEILRELEGDEKSNCNMKKQNIIFKVKHSNGVLERSKSGYVYKNLGPSRIDGFPMYSLEYPADEVFCFSLICRDFIFNGKPRYTPFCDDFELISSLEEELLNETPNNTILLAL